MAGRMLFVVDMGGIIKDKKGQNFSSGRIIVIDKS
jgi:hypothetical protein